MNIISQAAEHRPHKIEKLVYLAAYLIPNGKTQREYSMQDTEGVLKPFVRFHEDLNATMLALILTAFAQTFVAQTSFADSVSTNADSQHTLTALVVTAQRNATCAAGF